MNGYRGTKRSVSTHRLPIALDGPKTRSRPIAEGPQATFLAQLLADRPNGRTAATKHRDESEASCAYRRTDLSDIKRLPAGYRKTMSA